MSRGFVLIRAKMQRKRGDVYTVREWRAATKAAHQEQGEYWVKVYAPKHFTPGAKFKYKHKRRSKKYLERKGRLAASGTIEGGSADNLIYSGTLRLMARHGDAVKGYPARATITRNVPRYATFKPRGNRPNLGEEQMSVTDKEAETLAKVLDKAMQTRLPR